MSKLSRRRILTGSVGLAAAGASLGLGARFGRAGVDNLGAAKKLLLVVARGGWDTTYALDPKLGVVGIDAAQGELQTLGGLEILTDPARPAVTDFFSAWGSSTSLVRGLEIRSVSHNACSARVLTGTFSSASPDMGALLASSAGLSRPIPYLVLGRTAFSGPYASISARAGSTNQLSLLADQTNGVWFTVEPSVGYESIPGQEDLIRAHIDARVERERALRGELGANKRRLDEFLASLQRGDALMQEGALGDSEFLRTFESQVGVALNALATDLSQVVQLEFDDFDTHTNNSDQNDLHEQFFTGMQTLMDGLENTPGSSSGSKLLDETMVVVVSELGRTPKLNNQGGKDHWPVTCAMLMGAGVKGGHTIGASSDQLEGMAINLETGELDAEGNELDFRSFAAGVLESVGVDPEAQGIAAPPLRAFRT